MTEPDDALIDRIGADDEAAFAELYGRYALVVFSFVLSRTSDRSVVEEVSADTWLG